MYVYLANWCGASRGLSWKENENEVHMYEDIIVHIKYFHKQNE